MYFLNGDRIYIKPEMVCGNIEDQFEDCIRQLKAINSGKRIFKLNFFVDSESDEVYQSLKSKLRGRISEEWSSKIIQNYIAQPPLSCRLVIEAFFYDPSIWDFKILTVENGEAAYFRKDGTRVLVGNVQSSESKECRTNSEKAFGALNEIFETLNFSLGSIVRKWNYLEDILGFDGAKQRYQEFNDVRSRIYGDAFNENGYPAATGIGMNRGGVILEFVAVMSDKAVSIPIDNPEQVSAHHYSQKVLVGKEEVKKTTPKFERARYLELDNRRLLFISGTASILGEKTVGTGDPLKQTIVTMENIERLYSKEVLSGLPGRSVEPQYGHARVYVKERQDYPVIKRAFKAHYGRLPVVYILADICRDDLLVEIEGKAILK